MGIMIAVLHELNEIIKVFCPFLVAGLAVVILYWTSVTYGAITVLQVMGYDDGIRLYSIILFLNLLTFIVT